MKKYQIKKMAQSGVLALGKTRRTADALGYQWETGFCLSVSGCASAGRQALAERHLATLGDGDCLILTADSDDARMLVVAGDPGFSGRTVLSVTFCVPRVMGNHFDQAQKKAGRCRLLYV